MLELVCLHKEYINCIKTVLPVIFRNPDHFRSGVTSGHIYILSLFCAINACDFNLSCSNENVPLSVDNIIASCFELGHPVVLY